MMLVWSRSLGVLPSVALVAYGLGMPARKLPTPQDAAAARRIVLDGLARDRTSVPVREACQQLAQRPGYPAP